MHNKGGELALIYLVRHGQTDLIGKVLCGNMPGVHLNEIGRAQAIKTAEYLHNCQISAIYSSPMERALETATYFSCISNIEIKTKEFLREVNFGEFQGKDADFLHSQPVWQSFLKAPEETIFPGGESVQNAKTRISDGLEELSLHHKGENVVCFAHCEILLLAVCACLDLPLNNMHRLTIHPASVTLLEWAEDEKKLLYLNYQP